MKTMIQLSVWAAALLLSIQAHAFCGFYVAKADASLFNNKSEVIMVRNGNRNVITMSSDFKGELSEFAMVVPVPVVLGEKDIRVVERRIFDVLNDYSAPRLVNYYDNNPCGYDMRLYEDSYSMAAAPTMAKEEVESKKLTTYKGVRIEAQYDIDEYKIIILSAQESDGLQLWLEANGYKVPETARQVLEPYVRSNMKFFLVKVNLEKVKNRNSEYLRPIQISFDHAKFMLPLRLGMANSNGSQDMIVYALTTQGRVECTNYRTVKMPTDRNIPLYVEPKFGDFYKSLFEKTYKQEGRNAVFLEYAWNVSPYAAVKCDPCVGPPPVNYDFVEAGADWITQGNFNQTIFFTRLHVRYSRDKFPSDLQFQVTPNNENFQCRYVMTYPAQGSDFTCDTGQEYLVDLYNRRKKEVDELAALTGWSPAGGSSYIREYNQYLSPKTRENLRNEGIPAVIRPNTTRSLLTLAGLLIVFVSVFLLSRKQATIKIR
ncbi:MAG: DUF2330 domain-containing protein [Flavobacteriales bacterium]